MIKAIVNGKKEFDIDGNSMNGSEVAFDLVKVGENTYHLIKDNISYNATLVSFNSAEKTMVIDVNGTEYEIAVKDKNDLLLQKMGIKTGNSSLVKNIKAPMPGLIISIAVKEGDEVKKGDALLILEAMKMENIIKAPADVKIKSVQVNVRNAVEKNQVLIEFDL